MARYPYARYVASRAQGLDREEMQAIRDSYYSNSGRVKHYDHYVYVAGLLDLEPDPPPKGYVGRDFSRATKSGLAVTGLLGIFYWLLGTIAIGATGKMKGME